MEIRWTDEALDRLAEIRDYLEIRNPKAAQSVAERLIDAADSLEHLPYRGKKTAHGTFRLIIPAYRYRFILEYIITDKTASIVYVWRAEQMK